MPEERYDSGDDQRVNASAGSSNVFRSQYRTLTDDEKSKMGKIKDDAQVIYDAMEAVQKSEDWVDVSRQIGDFMAYLSNLPPSLERDIAIARASTSSDTTLNVPIRQIALRESVMWAVNAITK